jgi:hypothetical protein
LLGGAIDVIWNVGELDRRRWYGSGHGMDSSMKLKVRLLTVIAAAGLAGCIFRGDSGWKRTSVMTVHWERYKSVDAICRSVGSGLPPNDSDPPQICFGCRKVIGADCYIYTNEDRSDVVGGLVHDCFEQIQAKQKPE